MSDEKYIQDFGLIKDYIVYRLINPDKNKKLLEDAPHINFLDLSIVFHCLIGKDKICTSSNLICNAHFAQWGVPLNMLYEAASENTQRMMGYRIQSMYSVMCEMMTENPERFDDELLAKLKKCIPIYVVSNKDRTEGAACMLYPKLIEDFAQALGTDIYIIPSTIHDLLLLPVINEKSYIRQLIRKVNDSNMKPDEILSYSLYCYDRKMGEIIIC